MTDEMDRRDDGTVADGGTDSVDTSRSDGDDFGRAETGFWDEAAAHAVSKANHDFVLEAVRRMPLLASLRSGPATTDDLVESVDMSRSTVHRALSSLEEHDTVTNGEDGYRLTSLGKIVAAETEAYSNRTCTASSLSQFLNSINGHGTEIPIEYFVDAEITRREPRNPHTTIHRIIELFGESDSLRMLSTVISPVYVDVGYREMMDGMDIEAVFDREVVDLMLTDYPEKAHETIETGNFNVYAHEGLPFELFIFDDKIGMAAHNENGNAEVLVESDQTAAIDWAKRLYSKHRSEAQRLLLSE